MDYYKAPRLYSEKELALQEEITLEGPQAHYVRNVMRREVGDVLRLFDGVNGEFLMRLCEVKKKVVVGRLEECLRPQVASGARVRLYFSPLSKVRMDVAIEKCTELGVTDFHPVLTNRTENRKVNAPRVRAQIIEAAEQCERLDVPVLHCAVGLNAALKDLDTPLHWCCERDFTQRKTLAELEFENVASFLVGPAGGFDDDEVDILQRFESVIPISLGDRVLRSETACIVCLTAALIHL